jgi:peptidyl-prolyl cis-trans isomerase D
MISWIQTSLQKHTKFFIFFLLVAVTIPFVFTIGAGPGIGRAEQKVREQEFFGLNLGNEDQARRIFRDASFSAQLRGAFQVSGPQLQQFALNRIAGLALADEIGLPAPSEKEVAAYIAQLPVFLDEQGNFNQQSYQQFADSLKGNRDFGTADANRVFRDDTRLDALAKVLSGPGYVLPAEVAEQLKRGDTAWTVAVASVDYSKFAPTINLTDEALQKFYDDNSFRYEVPARPRLSVVEFRTAEFVPPVAPTEAEARSFYNANPARFPAPADAAKDASAPSFTLGQSAPASEDNFLKVRAQVESAMKDEAARRAASRAANDFTVALYERRAKANSPEVEAFLATQRRAAQPLAPVTFDNPPADFAWLANYAEQISRLSAERYFSDPLASPNGYIILIWHETLPGYQPLLNEVRERVAGDYRESEKRKRFAENGRALRERLQAAVNSGKSFADATKTENLEAKVYANFTLRQPPSDLPYAAYSALATLQQGQVSEMVTTGDQGHLTFASEMKLPDTSSANPRFAEVRQQLMQFTSSASENALLSALVEAELRRTAPAGAANP